MKKHFKYLSYVIRHKWFVFKACGWVGAPLWNSIIHDWSKFLPCEWFPYVWSFNGPWKYKDRPQHVVDAFDAAWIHHQHQNPHHWQHWVLREDSGAIKLLEMPEKYVREMVADWIGAGRAITGKYEAHSWYHQNKEKIQLHPKTKDLAEKILNNWEDCRQRMIRVTGHYYA